MRRDIDRTEIPPGSAYNMVDFIPDEIQAITGGRGGWTYSGPSATATSRINTIGYHPDTGHVVAVDNAGTGNFFDPVTGGALPNGGLSTLKISAPPYYHRGYLVFPNGSTPRSGAAVPPIGYNGTTTALIGAFGSVPSAIVGCVYKDHSVLANDSGTDAAAHPNRVWFSTAGAPTTWDMTYGWWDTSGFVSGLAPLSNAILIFHPDSTERLRGTTPPPGSDMILEPFLPNVGCLDPFSIAFWQQNAIWAAPSGVYMSNGVSTVDLTDAANLKTYWQSLISSYASTWRIAAGIYRDHYIVSINNGSTLVDCLCFSLTNRTAWRFTNLHGSSFVNVQAAQQEKLHMGQFNGTRVAELSSLWSPSATVKQDGDGTNPTPIIETGMFRGYDRLHRRWIESMGKQKWRFAYVDYDLRDSASDLPTMALSSCKTPTGSYTQAGTTLPATTDYSRVRRSFSPTQGGATHSQMLGLKLAVTGPYASAKLYTLEGTFEPIEIGAL